MNEMLVEVFKHNTWANVRMIEFCRDLPVAQVDNEQTLAGTYGKIRDTMLHLVTASEGYLVTYGRWSSKPEPVFKTWDDLVARARASGEAYQQWVAETQVADSNDADFGPETWRAATWIIQTQMIDHDTEHRTHAGTVMAQFGVQSPPVDMWAYGADVGLVTHWEKK